MASSRAVTICPDSGMDKVHGGDSLYSDCGRLLCAFFLRVVTLRMLGFLDVLVIEILALGRLIAAIIVVSCGMLSADWLGPSWVILDMYTGVTLRDVGQKVILDVLYILVSSCRPCLRCCPRASVLYQTKESHPHP